MKTLTSILLTLLVLGGCSQEPSQLKKCMERYIPKLENDDIFAINIVCKSTASTASARAYQERIWNESEIKKIHDDVFNQCIADEKRNMLQGIYKDKILYDYKAERFCNSQGIY